MGDAADLAYVDAVLSGAAPVGVEPPKRGKGGRRQGAAARVTRATSARSQHNEAGGARARRASDAQLATASAGPSASPGEAHSIPSDRSSSRVLHCDACDVWVPRRPGDWETHIAGIRHRRQMLSLREHGERGHLVQSVFESAPHEQPPHRLAGKAGAHFAGVPHGGGTTTMPPSAASPEARAIAQRLRTAALAQMLNMCSSNSYVYSAGAALFSEAALGAVYTEMLQRAAPVAGKFYTVPNEYISSESSKAGLELAVASQLVRDGTWAPSHLEIGIKGGFDWGGGAVAACFAGMQMLLAALGERSTPVPLLLLRLWSIFMQGSAGEAAVAQGWMHLSLTLRSLLESGAVRRLHVTLLPCISDDGPKYSGRLEDTFHVAGLEDAADAAVRARRDALLLGVLHPRCGRCSLLQLLPAPLLLAIVDESCADDGFCLEKFQP